MSDYRPIACIDHERLEFAALTQQWLNLRVDGSQQRLLPKDVYTSEGAEWLVAQTETGEQRTLRLDCLGF